MGDLQRIHIGHDNSGLNSAWFVDKVLIEDFATKKVYSFIVQRWLSEDKEDHQIECDVFEGEQKQPQMPLPSIVIDESERPKSSSPEPSNEYHQPAGKGSRRSSKSSSSSSSVSSSRSASPTKDRPTSPNTSRPTTPAADRSSAATVGHNDKVKQVDMKGNI